MYLIAAADDKMGMAFNKRRVSSDKAVTGKILSLVKGSCLWVNAYTYKLFENIEGADIRIDEDFLKKAGRGEYCFAEDVPVREAPAGLEGIILFKWNRRYPADVFFEIDLRSMRLCSSEEFEGNSHKSITMEIYRPAAFGA